MSGPAAGRPGPHSAPHTRVVVVGASLAGLRAAEALRGGGFAGRLTIVGDEVHAPYDRPPLSKAVLAGTADREDVVLASLAALDAQWRLGVAAVRLDLRCRRVVLADGTYETFDGLVLATGARARRLPGAEQIDGVHVLRTLDDALQLRRALLTTSGPVAVLGAGFIGSEVAAAAVALGRQVTLVDAASLPMLAALGPDIARFCAALHRRHGVELRLATLIAGLETTAGDTGARGRSPHGTRRLSAVELADPDGPPRRLPAELAVVGLGAVPNTDWLADSGLLLDSGVLCDQTLTVLGRDGPVAGIVAAGDVARWPHPLFDGELVRVEHWSNAVAQAQAAAATLLSGLTGQGAPRPFSAVPSFWSDQYDVKVLSVGLPQLAADSRVLHGDPATGRFLVGFGRAGRLVGAAAVGLPGRLAAYRQLIGQQAPWPPPASTEPSRTPAAVP